MLNENHEAQLPSWSIHLLNWVLPETLKEPIIGDLSEGFHSRALKNPQQAHQWYFNQVVKTTFHYLLKTKGRLFMFLFSLAVFVGVVIMAMFMGGEITDYINVPSLIIVVPPAIIFAKSVASTLTIKEALVITFGFKPTADINTLKEAHRIIDVLGNSAMWMGWIGVVLGAVAMGANIEKEVFADVIGPATAVCLLTLLYAMLIKAVCYVGCTKLKGEFER